MNKQAIFAEPAPAAGAGSNRRGWLLLLAAVLSGGLYAILPSIAGGLNSAEPSFVNHLWPGAAPAKYLPIEELRENNHASNNSLGFLATMAALFGIYFGMLRLLRGEQSPWTVRVVFAAGTGFLLTLALAPILLSSDVYFYALYGRILSVYGASPYADGMAYAESDPFGILLKGLYLPSWYGPLWTLICAGLTRITGDNVGLTVLAFRLLAVLSALGIAVLIWWTLRRLDPKRATQGLVLFLWNPLMILETGLSAHNDVVMLSFVLVGVVLHLKGRKSLAVVALTLSALVKFLTGMLLPLYIWLVLRECRTWGERGRFLIRSSVAAGLVSLVAIWGAKAHRENPTSQAATATDFYGNNFHELAFKGLRRLLGEDASSVSQDIYFQGWWLAANQSTDFTPVDHSVAPARRLDKGGKVFVVARQMTSQARVYDPATRRIGWVDSTQFHVIPRPKDLPSDPELERRQLPLMDWPTVRAANHWIRGVTWVGFALFGLLAAWRTTDFQQFLIWSGASLVASYYFIITEIWPWYPIWAVSLGALAPSRLPALLATILSACVVTLHVTIGYEDSPPAWVFAFRSVPAFVLPLLIFLILVAGRKFTSHGNARTG